MKILLTTLFLLLTCSLLTAQNDKRFLIGIEPYFAGINVPDPADSVASYNVLFPVIFAGFKPLDFLEVSARVSFISGNTDEIGVDIDGGFGYGVDTKLLVSKLLPINDNWARDAVEYYVTAKYLRLNYATAAYGGPERTPDNRLNEEYQLGAGLGMNIFANLWVRVDYAYATADFGVSRTRGNAAGAILYKF